MQKGFLLAACILQHLILIAQTEKTALSAQRAFFEATQLVDPSTGKIPVERLYEAYNTTLKQQKQRRGKSLNWIEMGPQDDVSGRIRSLLIMPDNRKAFTGGITGGLWVTDDITTGVWKPVNDFFFNLNVSTIAADPSDPTGNTLYFGTGEDYDLSNNQQAAYSGETAYNRGQGIWKSIDGGTTWNQLQATVVNTALVDFHMVRKIIVNNQGDVFASTRNGIYKKAQNQTTWSWSLSENVQANDLKMGADGTIYASTGLANQSGTVYRLQPGGNQWEALRIVSTPDAFSRIELACSARNANRVYALVKNRITSSNIGVYRSVDRGTTWNLLTIPSSVDNNFTQAAYALSIAVDPNNDNQLYLGGQNLYQCSDVTDLSQPWTSITVNSPGASDAPYPNYVHADHHQIIFESGSSSTVYIATDGGLFRSDNVNSTSPKFNAINKNLRITQFFTVSASSESYTFKVLAGSQDNGTKSFDKSYLSNPRHALNGDGAYCFINPNNASNQVASSYFGTYRISSTRGGIIYFPTPLITSLFFTKQGRGSFINPTDWALLPSPSHPVNMFSDGNKYSSNMDPSTEIQYIYRWNNIFSSTMTVDSFADRDIFRDLPPAGDGLVRRISFIKVSPNSPDIVYIGLSDRTRTTIRSRLIRMSNANGVTPTFTDITGDLYTTAYISSIALKKEPSGVDKEIVLTFSNYGTKNIWRTTNADAASLSWQALDINYQSIEDGRLPDMPVRYALFPPETTSRNPYGYKLLIATETGIWATKNFEELNTKWYPINDNKLPNVRTQMLTYRESDGMLFVATHGRGLWRSDMFSNTKVDFTATVVQEGWGRNTRCNLILLDQSEGASAWKWDLNNDEIVDGIHPYQKFDYCGNPYQEIKLTINPDEANISVVKRLNEMVTHLPTYCPCTTISTEEETILVLFNKPKKRHWKTQK
jgi:hypothetical protein